MYPEKVEFLFALNRMRKYDFFAFLPKCAQKKKKKNCLRVKMLSKKDEIFFSLQIGKKIDMDRAVMVLAAMVLVMVMGWVYYGAE